MKDSKAKMSISIESIEEIINKYNYYIIDLWGVIHDGQKLYPYSVETLKQLKDFGKKILFLSNSPKRAFKARETLKNFGVEETLYDYILTSGEFLYNNISNIIKGDNYYHIGPEENQDVLKGLAYCETSDLENCDFLLVTGLFDHKVGFTNEVDILKNAKELNIPVLCSNPDIIVITQEGKEHLCAGAVAREYAKMGGNIHYVGKPFSEIYVKACEILGCKKQEVIAIGDSLNTDIKGANNFGIDSILIKGGIHSNELKDHSINEIITKYSQIPNFHTNHFR